MKSGLVSIVLAFMAALLAVAHAQLYPVSPPCGTRPADFRPIAVTACKPAGTLTKTKCLALNRKCFCQHQTNMKWTGPACSRGTNDGGCRCGTFCGFKCDKKCNADKACIKNNVLNQCVNKITGDAGATSMCFMTKTPTTWRPTGSPTTAKPSVSPTTPVPSTTPTTSKPSANPSQTPSTTSPSRTPSIAPTLMPSQAPIIPTFMPSHGPGTAMCKPMDGLNAATCSNIRQYCVTQNVIMKFAGPGCLINGKRLRDGGCQCQGYCGYGCAKACRRDSECFWDTGRRACIVKATNETGVKIPQCNEQVINP